MLIEYTPEFKRSARKLSRRYRSLKADLDSLLNALESGDTPGDQLQHQTRYPSFKVRVKNSDALRGKSGGYRVIYYVKYEERTVLVTLYSKSDQEDVSSSELQRIIEKYEEHRED